MKFVVFLSLGWLLAFTAGFVAGHSWFLAVGLGALSVAAMSQALSEIADAVSDILDEAAGR